MLGLRVAINAYFGTQPHTGSGQYLQHLSSALSEAAPHDSFIRVQPTEHSTSDSCGSRGPSGDSPKARIGFLSKHIDKLRFEQVTMPRVARHLAADVLHYPYFAAPWRSPVPVVVTVHDLIPLLLPAYRGGLSAQAYSALVRWTTARTQAIVADSECSRRDILRLLGYAEDRISVVYLAASSIYKRMQNRDDLAECRAGFGLPETFILYLGGLDVRKNVPRLLRAFAELLRQRGTGLPLPADLKLAIVGQPRSSGPVFPDLEAEIQRLGIERDVVFLGVVSPKTSVLLYNAAALFVFPSLYEGFGLPPLEAMSCGLPVVCSKASSLPEVVGEAALLVDPTSEGDLAQAMARVLTDLALRAELTERGLRRAAGFSWRRAAEQTLDVYRAVAAAPH